MEELAAEGYMLLAERLRRDQDKDVIKVNTSHYIKVTSYLTYTLFSKSSRHTSK